MAVVEDDYAAAEDVPPTASEEVMVVKLEGIPAGLESSDETAVDSWEPDSMDFATQSEIQKADVDLRRPNFRVDASDGHEELIMTPEEADSLLSSR